MQQKPVPRTHFKILSSDLNSGKQPTKQPNTASHIKSSITFLLICDKVASMQTVS